MLFRSWPTFNRNTNVTVKPSKGTTVEADNAKLAVCVAASPAWLTNSNNEGATKAVGVLSMVSLNVTTNVPSFKSKALAANTAGRVAIEGLVRKGRPVPDACAKAALAVSMAGGNPEDIDYLVTPETAGLVGAAVVKEAGGSPQDAVLGAALAAAKAKKVKAAPIAKSLIIWEVKPWGEETDLNALAEKILAIELDGQIGRAHV